MKILLDTNIVIDALTNRQPFGNDAKEIFCLVAEGALEAYLTANLMSDIYYLLRKDVGNDDAKKQSAIS